MTGTYGARYVSAGGGAVNIVSRSGTNQIHGTLIEFLRNGYTNATGHEGIPDNMKRNQFGGALGAPLIKSKLFIFGAFEDGLQHWPAPALRPLSLRPLHTQCQPF